LEEQGELSEAMRRTRQEAVRMGDLVDDMLLLARLDEGRPLDQSRVDVAALAEDAGRDARAVDPERDVVVRVEGRLEVMGDGDRLRQVIANLVGNALVHTPSSARLDIRARRDGDRAVVEVSDRGEGMPPDVLGQAFDRFYRADPSRSRHRGGSGLGLAIVQAAVAAHGGEVALDSTPGEGTTARITLPLAPAGTGDDDCQEAHR
jgi:two-component system OmpR family sensor kinase